MPFCALLHKKTEAVAYPLSALTSGGQQVIFSRGRRHVNEKVPFAESDLNQVEEVSAEKISGNRLRAETDLKPEVAEVGMRKLQMVEPCFNVVAGGGPVQGLTSAQEVKA